MKLRQQHLTVVVLMSIIFMLLVLCVTLGSELDRTTAQLDTSLAINTDLSNRLHAKALKSIKDTNDWVAIVNDRSYSCAEFGFLHARRGDTWPQTKRALTLLVRHE